MGMLWPGLTGPLGDVMGLPFALEGISFFTEAIFLGIYLYGWDRLPGRIHSLMLVPVPIARATHLLHHLCQRVDERAAGL